MLRQVRGRWVTTTANVWATIALDAFGKKFEKEAVTGSTRAVLGAGTPVSHAWASSDAATGPALARQGRPDDKLALAHEGGGKPWASVQVLAAVPPPLPGLRLQNQAEVTPVTQKVPGKFRRGDVLMVRLSVESDQDMAWVVINDPIPGGAASWATATAAIPHRKPRRPPSRQRLARLRRTHLQRLPRLLRPGAQGVLLGIHPTAQQRRRLRPAGDAGGGDVCAGGVRGGAERAGGGGARVRPARGRVAIAFPAAHLYYLT